MAFGVKILRHEKKPLGTRRRQQLRHVEAYAWRLFCMLRLQITLHWGVKL